MFKLFALCLAILSLISVIQCTPTPSKRAEPSPLPRNLVARGHCDFYCPQENAAGKELSSSDVDSGRLYCRYDVEEMDDDKAFCMYQRSTGELLSNSSPCKCGEQAVFLCPGTKNGQQEIKWEEGQPKRSRSVNLPQFVKARSMARRAVEADTGA